MSVSDGQPVSAAITNAAYISRITNSNTVAKIDLENIDTTSIIGLQRFLNELVNTLGIANQAATDPNATTYLSNNKITNGESLKQGVEALDAAFDLTTGHDHDGANSKQIDANNLLNLNQVKNSLLVFADDTAFETDKGSAATEGNIYYNSTSDRVRVHDGSTFTDLGGLINMIREVPTGLINGANTAFTLALLPLSDAHVSVYVDGRFLNDSEVSISGSNLTLTDAPALGQDVFVWYVTEGIVSAITPVPGTRNVEYLELSLADETNENVTLSNTPADNNKVILDLIGGSAQEFGVDYTVSGTTLSWNGLALSGILVEGDKLRIIYDS